MVFANHRGKLLGEMPQSATLLKRGLLNKGLREAAIREGVVVEFGKRLKDVEVTPRRGVVARFEDGSEAGGALLVGCDGINSKPAVRSCQTPPSPPTRASSAAGDSPMYPASLHTTASCT